LKLDRNNYEEKLLKENQFIKINKLNLNFEKKKKYSDILILMPILF